MKENGKHSYLKAADLRLLFLRIASRLLLLTLHARGQCPAYSGKSKVRNDLYNCLIIIKTSFIQEHLKRKREGLEGVKVERKNR